ncbi:cysteine hydrolase family protein [Clostridium paraputrificum]|uniref:cysteine hydrolase family protein n=1 Tax=Clostridium paraputrificum TaxID=29363 RepID=UPI003D33DEC8
MNKSVLLIVDVQKALVKKGPYNEDKVIDNIKKLISAARSNEKEVIYICHDDGKGEELEKGTDGWQVYDDVAPNKNERVFDKEYNSAFHKTDLKEYLDSKGINTIILVGLQTEYCIDATCKSAFDNGYKIIIPEGTNTTFSNEYLPGEKLYEFYNYKIWNKRFANVIPLDEVISNLEDN